MLDFRLARLSVELAAAFMAVVCALPIAARSSDARDVAQEERAAARRDASGNDDVAIYRVLADSYLPADGRVYILLGLTQPFKGSDGAFIGIKDEPGFRKDAFEDFLRRNHGRRDLPKFACKRQLRLMDNEELEQILAEGSWEELYRRVPDCGGTFSLTAPGYSKDGMFAVVCVMGSWGREEGWGAVVTLHRTKRGWAIQNELGRWQE